MIQPQRRHCPRWSKSIDFDPFPCPIFGCSVSGSRGKTSPVATRERYRESKYPLRVRCIEIGFLCLGYPRFEWFCHFSKPLARMRRFLLQGCSDTGGMLLFLFNSIWAPEIIKFPSYSSASSLHLSIARQPVTRVRNFLNSVVVRNRPKTNSSKRTINTFYSHVRVETFKIPHFLHAVAA